MLTAASLAFIVNIGGAVFNWIFRKAGRRVTQIVIFLIALFAATYYQYGAQFPVFQSAVAGAIVLFSMAVAFYEVLLKYFPLFAGPQEEIKS